MNHSEKYKPREGVGAIQGGLQYHYDNYKKFLPKSKKAFEKHIKLLQELHNNKEDPSSNTEYGELYWKHQKIIEYMKHEIVAYLNRIGQFYSFAKGIIKFQEKEKQKNLLLKENIINKQVNEKIKDLLPTIYYIIPLRNKYSAHRAVDCPKGEDPIRANQLNQSFSVASSINSNGGLEFNLRIKKESYIDFILEKKHEEIKKEIQEFLIKHY